MELRAEGYQFLSRTTISNRLLGTLRVSPEQRPDIVFELVLEVRDKPFEINFAQLPPSRPSIGASQYVDAETDIYMSRRWPKCFVLTGTILFPERAHTDPLVRNFLTFLRKLLWYPPETSYASLFGHDQSATVRGYRREYFDRQIFDIEGIRRPYSGESYVPTEVGEPVGPGVVSLPSVDAMDGVNELVWTPVLPFQARESLVRDLPDIRDKVAALRTHYNSYNELQDAHRHIANGEVKASIRSGASAVDAILHYYCGLWAVPLPPKNLRFDEKIEHVLRIARKPSYKSVAPDVLVSLLYLYRSRNSMHEGDCYFDDMHGARNHLRSVEQVRPFISAVEEFVIWLDALT